MKKLLGFLFPVTFIALVGVVVLGLTPVAQAQVPYGFYCCDGYGVRRCEINPSPIGSQCFCYGQGYGITCP